MSYSEEKLEYSYILSSKQEETIKASNVLLSSYK